jgi:hypothetical protein
MLSLRTRYAKNQREVLPDGARGLALTPNSLRSFVPPKGRTLLGSRARAPPASFRSAIPLKGCRISR